MRGSAAGAKRSKILLPVKDVTLVVSVLSSVSSPVQNPSSLCAFASLREIFSVFVFFVIFPYCANRIGQQAVKTRPQH